MTSLLEAMQQTMAPPVTPIGLDFSIPPVGSSRADNGKAARIALRFEAKVDEFERDTSRFRSRVAKWSASEMSVPELLRQIDEVVAYSEASAQNAALSGARSEKDFHRMVKALSRDPSAGTELRAATQRISRAEARVVRLLLELALFLRSYRSEIDPTSRNGPTFDNADDLSRHLDSLITR